ncbi:MAG TPA: hypothetical protein VF701_19820 [Thermoanaerobaculia bacterium]
MRPLTPLTSAQIRTVVAVSLLIALSRLLAVARSMFDWDEGLFALAVREYDVPSYQPHPPGYPLFIAAAKLFHHAGLAEFRSLQAIALLGAILIFPALFALAREAGFDFTTAVCGAALFAFLPNVWVYGGTGFSDVPAMAVVFTACALLLRGRGDRRAFIAGAALLGVAAGIRPPNLLIGALPALMATWSQIQARAWRSVVAAILAGAAIVAASYGGAALASSSTEAYVEAIQIQSKYVRDVDSWRNPHRAPLHDAAKEFFLWPMFRRGPMVAMAVFALVSLFIAIRRRWLPPLLLLGIFGPFAILAWLNLDIHTAARYAISYMALHALLAADGVRVILRRPLFQAAAVSAGIVATILWTLPALQVQRTMTMPPVAAIDWVAANASTSEPVYVHSGIGPQATFLLSNRQKVFFDDRHEISLLGGGGWLVDVERSEGARVFSIPRNAFWNVIRRRNFEIYVSRTEGLIRFGDGWYDQEGDGEQVWRWMGREAHVALPPVTSKGRLAMTIYVPIDTLAVPPVVAIYLNGVLLETIEESEAYIERTWLVDSRTEELNELRIVTSDSVSPARVSGSQDTRELGLRINALSWGPAK